MKILKFFASALCGIALCVSCGGDRQTNQEDDRPLEGVWVSPDQSMALAVIGDSIRYEDYGMDGESFSSACERQSNNKLTFDLNGHSGSLVYNPSDSTVNIKIKGYWDGGDDFEVTIPAEYRFDRVTPIMGWSTLRLKNPNNPQEVDTLRMGESALWLADTLKWQKIRLDNGKIAYALTEDIEPVRGKISDEAFDLSYGYDFSNPRQRVIYSFEKKGNQVAILCSTMPLDGGPAYENYYLGDIKGTVITVSSTFNDYNAYDAFNTAETSPLDTPFKIHVVDGQGHRLVIDSKNYKPFDI